MTAHVEQTTMDEMVAWLREVLAGDAEAAQAFESVRLTTHADPNTIIDTQQARDRYQKMVAPEQVVEDVVAKQTALDLYTDLRTLTDGVEGLRDLPHQNSFPLAALDTAEKMVRTLAQGYQYRPGWKTVWEATG